MKTIHKYKLPRTDHFALDLPQGAEVLCVQAQKEVPYIWAVVDPEHPPAPIWFALRATGQPIDAAAAGRYVGTFQLCSGALVFHLFQEKP
jgi:hypothetical protein